MYEADKMLNELFSQSSWTFVDKGEYYSFVTPLAGARKEDVHVFVKDRNQLTIAYEPKEKNPYAPSFSKFWGLRDGNLEEVKAELKDGLLTVTVPKQKPAQPKVRTVVVN